MFKCGRLDHHVRLPALAQALRCLVREDTSFNSTKSLAARADAPAVNRPISILSEVWHTYAFKSGHGNL
ncbi:MAG: hypothetical protein RJP95_01175 [Pirellulales bacterium]